MFAAATVVRALPFRSLEKHGQWTETPVIEHARTIHKRATKQRRGKEGIHLRRIVDERRSRRPGWPAGNPWPCVHRLSTACLPIASDSQQHCKVPHQGPIACLPGKKLRTRLSTKGHILQGTSSIEQQQPSREVETRLFTRLYVTRYGAVCTYSGLINNNSLHGMGFTRSRSTMI